MSSHFLSHENFKFLAPLFFSVYNVLNTINIICTDSNNICIYIYMRTTLIHNWNIRIILFSFTHVLKAWFARMIFKFQLFLKDYENNSKICHEFFFSYIAGVLYMKQVYT